jgi:predicted outer membrane repeat protein
MAAVAVVVAGAPASATTISVATETEYRNALTTLSADGSGPHVIEVTADITIAGATDPVYTGTQPLTINGNGNTLDGGNNSRILDHNTSVLLTVNEVTMANGAPAGGANGGAVEADGPVTITDSTFTGNLGDDGGALNAAGPVTITRSRFENNGDATGVTEDGGAVNNSGDTTVTDSTFVGNEGENGGAVYNGGTDTVRVTNSTFSGNKGTQSGGAISASKVTVSGSTFDGNESLDDGEGGAIRSYDSLDAVNTTFTGNVAADDGGAVFAGGTVSLVHVTMSSNSAPEGANVLIEEGALTAFATVIADPQGGGQNCLLPAPATSNGYNYSDDASCGFTGTGDTENGADPQLLALGDFGGPTQTRPPAVTSPLVDAIPVADCDPAVTTDQRGLPRPSDGNSDGINGCDIGAVELQATSPPTATPAPTAGPVAARPSFTG